MSYIKKQSASGNPKLEALCKQKKEKYLSAFKNMTITCDHRRNGLMYQDGRGNILSVSYQEDCETFLHVFSKFREVDGVETKWECLDNLLNNLGSSKFYYDFSSSYNNPYSVVAPDTLSDCENQGLFDVMMETAAMWIEQKQIPAYLGVRYVGYGWANTPTAVAHRNTDVRHYGEEPYDKDILYTQKYFQMLREQKSNIANEFEPENSDVHFSEQTMEL